MTEDEAIAWVSANFGAAGYDRMRTIVDAVTAENELQNLVARASIASIWARHIVDSAQLLAHAPAGWTRWLDVGTGGGFPGLVIAMLSEQAVMLVEPRRKRAGFLRTFIDRAQVGHRVEVRIARVEGLRDARFDVVSARAVASVDELFGKTANVADLSTTYLLPRGATVAGELENVRRGWHGMFHVEPSLTSADSGILIAREIRRR